MKVYRAGLIPYIIEDRQIKMLFMCPSDPKFGTEFPQISKGKIEGDELPVQCAVREAEEELGLIADNMVAVPQQLGLFLTRTYVFIVRVKDKTRFGDVEDETARVVWLTEDEFAVEGRELHRPIVKAAMRRIRNVERGETDLGR